MNYIHSVELDEKLCVGCTDCIKRCPTDAIRVRNGKAIIFAQKCIDCGLCIRICSHKAKKASTQHLSVIENYKVKIAIPAPTLYSQFYNETDVNVILTALKGLGFDDVFEVSLAAQAVTEATKKLLAENKLRRPVISSACPAVMRLIAMRFPSLIDNILPLIAPVEAAAIAAKNRLVSQGVKREDIGVFFISPCAAKHTYAIAPIGIDKTEIDGVIAISDIYLAMETRMRHFGGVEKLVQCNELGVDWALTGGESKGVKLENAIAVDGVENVMRVLEEVEDGKLDDVDFIEGLACTGGCVGGPLTVVNSFVSKNRLRRVEKLIQSMDENEKRPRLFDFTDVDFSFSKRIKPVPVMLLDEDMATAIRKIEELRKMTERLPGIDCGSCGAPTCKALAEDIVRGEANEEDCIFMLRDKVKQLAEAMVDLSAKMPQTLRKTEKKEDA